MPRNKAPNVGFGVVPLGSYKGDVSGGVPNGVGPVIAGDFFVDRSTTPAIWLVNTGAALSSNATIYGVFTGAGSTATVSAGNSSLFTGAGVVIAGTTTPSTPVAVSTAGTSGFGLVARSSIAAPNVRWEHVELFALSSLFATQGQMIAGSTDASTPVAVPVATATGFAPVYRTSVSSGIQFEHVELFGLSSLYGTQGQLVAGSTTPSTPLAVTATTVLGAAPVYRSTSGVGLAFEIPNSTFYSGQGVFIVGTSSAGMTVVAASTADGLTPIWRSSVASGVHWERPTVSFKDDPTWAVAGAISVPSSNTDFIPPKFVKVGADETVTLDTVSYVLNGTTGATATFSIRLNGSTVATMGALSCSTVVATATSTATNTLANLDQIAPVVTAVSGTPKSLTVTVGITRVVKLST